MLHREFLRLLRLRKMRDSGEIWRKSMIKMPDLDGIDMIPDLTFRFLMTMEKFCVIMFFMWSLL